MTRIDWTRAGRRVAAVGLAAALLAGCAREQAPDLLRLTSDEPDEFAILPGKPLEAPPSFSSLPPPTPGGASRTDPTPLSDAASALGGRRPAEAPQTSAIREQLAAEDLEQRRGGSPRLMERLFGIGRYDEVYEDDQLDAQGELDRFRRAGIRTPAAPPPGE